MEYARFFLTDAFTAAAICCTGLLLALLNCKAVIAGYKQAWQILRHWKLEKYDPQSQRLLARCIAGLLCILVLGAISAPKLRYALPLLFEDVGQLEQIEGRIERVKNADVNDIYRYRDTYEHPKLIQVGEKRLFTLALGELKEGDAVCVSYLPHSRLALSILPKGAQAQTTPEFGREFYCFRALVPLSLSLFAAAFGLLAWALLDTGTQLWDRRGQNRLPPAKIAALVVAGALLLTLFGTDLRRGLALYRDRAPVTLDGTVEQRTEAGGPILYRVNGEVMRAEYLQVGGETLYNLPLEDFAPGDTVRVQYYPGSGVVRRIEAGPGAGN